MVLLPVLVGVDVSSRRAAVVLASTFVGFAVAGVHDHVLMRRGRLPDDAFHLGLYAFLGATAFVVVRTNSVTCGRWRSWAPYARSCSPRR